MMKRFFLTVAIAAIFVSAAHAQEITPQRVASCQLVAEYLRGQAQSGTEDYARYNVQAEYWATKVVFFEPVASEREALLSDGRASLANALAQRDAAAGMTLVSNVLAQCEAGRSEIEAVAPNG